MFSVLLSLLPESEGIVGAEYDLFGTEHSGNAGDDGFIGGSRRVVKKLAKIMTWFVLASALTKGSLDSTGKKGDGSAHVSGNDFEIWIFVEEASQHESR